MRGIQRDMYLPRAILNKIPHLAHLYSLAYLHMRRSLKCTTCKIFFQNCGCNTLRTKHTLGVLHTPSCVFRPFCAKIPSPHIVARLNARPAKFSVGVDALIDPKLFQTTQKSGAVKLRFFYIQSCVRNINSISSVPCAQAWPVSG